MGLIRKVEAWLYGKGFSEPVLREMMLAELGLLAVSVCCAVVALWFTRWPLLFVLGAAVIVFNFWYLCRFVFRYFDGSYSRQLLAGHLFGFFWRFLLSGLVLGAAFALGGSPVAVSAGVFACAGTGAVVALLGLRKRRV